MRTIFISYILIAFAYAQDVAKLNNTKKTLEILHVVFRHGDRTPDSLHPKDPYTEKDFDPIRIGHLTNKGKMREYKIGISLRNKYNDFIPKTYTPEIVQSISSDYSRTRASLELVLAGLFPPTKELTWNEKLLWEPIPYDYLEKSQNKIFMPSAACPLYDELLKNVSKTYKSPIEAKYKRFLPSLQRLSGLKNDSVAALAVDLYSTLKSEQELGFDLPTWTKRFYPQMLEELAAEYWAITSKGVLKSLSVGFLISRIINNTLLTIEGDPAYKDTKIYLYSGHDANIAWLLSFLDNFTPPHNPNYGAHVIIEVHKISGRHYLKFRHENYEYKEPTLLTIPKCGDYCPLETFVKLYGKQIDSKYLNYLCG